ncbi:MAG: endopeptidase La [Geobacteraceae bacterium]|nr:endopeptidase La [Geobacteraceae bacterium]
MSEAAYSSIPEVLPLYPLRDMVAFPYMMFPLFLPDEELPAFEEAMRYQNFIALFRKRDDVRQSSLSSYYETGTVCKINQFVKLAEGGAKLSLEGIVRVRLEEVVLDKPCVFARLKVVREFTEKSVVSDALMQSLNALLKIALSYGRPLPDDVLKMIDYIDNPARFSDLVALYLTLPLDELQDLLDTADPIERLKKVYIHLTNEVQRLQVRGEVQAEVTKRVGKTQKEYLLREQMKQIQEELGEDDTRTSDHAELRKKISGAGMPDAVRKIAEKELKRLERINPASPEYTVSRTYLDYLVGMPWRSATVDNNDIDQAESVLNEDHYDLEKVKERILEFLAVRSLREKIKGPILCFVGPPGVGKTSLGNSIARSLGRKFIRLSLGGMRDEAEIRGHRRTYIGALPGRIIQEIYRCGANNPVFMLDEVDKIGQDFRGDPASALLEVLDPEQNFSFSDHYLDVPFDLSHVMFITTANLMDTIPPPLRDRMEVIHLSGYTDEEKEKIAFRFLIPKELEENGLSGSPPRFEVESVYKIIREYTREAGVRNLQRTIASICRKMAKEVMRKKPSRASITSQMVEEFLGPRKFFDEVAAEKDRIGVVTGLAWTETGGDIIFVEATRMVGRRELILTGSLGAVMRESAQAALSFVRANCAEWGIPEQVFRNMDIHIHVPAGSVPKDGPSAGITMASAIISLLTQRPARRDVAMTGEISLSGRVLPIGGLKEKLLAAHRAGVRIVVVPKRNKVDMEDVPATVRSDLEIVFIDDVREAASFSMDLRETPPVP